MVWPYVFVDDYFYSNWPCYWVLPYQCWLCCRLCGPLDLVSHQLGCRLLVAWHSHRRHMCLVCAVIPWHASLGCNMLCITWYMVSGVDNRSLRLGGHRVRLLCGMDVCVHCIRVRMAMDCLRCFSSVVMYSSMFCIYLGYDCGCFWVFVSQLFAAVCGGTEELRRCGVVTLPQAMLAVHMAGYCAHNSNSVACNCFRCLQCLD